MGEKAVRGEQISDGKVAGAELLLHERLGEHVGEAAAAETLRQHERRQPEA